MKSIRIRLVLLLIVPLAILASIVAFETFFNARKISNTLHDQTLLAVMLAISENVSASDGDVLAEATLEVLTSNFGDQFFYHLAGPNNAFMTGYTGVPPLPTHMNLQSGVPVFYDALYQGDNVRVAALRQFSSTEFLGGWSTITTWRRVSQRDGVTLDLFGRSLGRLALLIISAGIIVWFAVAIGLRPINNLRAAIERRSSNDLSPIKRAMPAELQGIAGSMNKLLARVTQSKVNRERFIGDAAHQLRNPVAAIKLQAQTAIAMDSNEDLRAGLERVLEITNQTNMLVENMLTSAGANAVSTDQFEEFDLTKMVTDIARFLAPKALAKEQDYSFSEASENIIFWGHRILLREAITNLVENAIRHNNVGATIFISLGWKQNDVASERFVEVSIYDDGDGLTPDMLNKMSQPFATGETQSASSGLGLSIAKDVAKAHGGDLNVVPSGDQGKTVSLILPERKP